MRPTFLFWLFNALRRALYLDSAGNMQEADGDYKKPNGQPAHLIESPDGWSNVEVKYARNIRYWGLFRDMITSLKFVGDGFRIVKNYCATFGFEAVMSLGVSKLDRTSLPYTYDSWHVSELNFVKLQEEETSVTIEALEGGISKYLKAYENTVYEIPIDTDPQHINVLFDGMKIFQNGKYSLSGEISNEDITNFHPSPVVFINSEGDTGGTNYQSQIVENIGGVFSDYINNSLNFFLENNTGEERTYRIVGKMEVTCIKNDINAAYRTDFFRSGDGNVAVAPIFNTGVAMVVGQKYSFNYDVNVTLQDGQNLKSISVFFGLFPGGAIEVAVNWHESSSIIVEFDSKFKNTFTKGHYPLRVAQLLIEKMTNGLYEIRSEFLNNLKDCFITSGDALRGIVTNDTDPANIIKGAVIKTSWSDFFKSMSHFSIFCGVQNDYLIVEKLSDAFKPDVILDLGQVTKAKKICAEDLLFNTVRVGGPNKDYDNVNGKYETNQEKTWALPITKVQKEADWTSGYRRDAYGAEFERINLEGKITTDSESDGDNWMINIEKLQHVDTETGIIYYKLNRPAFTTIEGVPDPNSYFNALYSPKWSLYNNGALLRSICDLMDTSNIVFTSGEKNNQLKTVLDVSMDEDEAIQIGALAVRYFAPWYFTFTTEVPLNLLTVINSNPYGKIKFRWNNKDWYGYLFDGGVKPAINDIQTWKLLAAPDQDFSKFNN